MIHRKNGKRKGSVLVEYGLLIVGIAIASVVAIAVLGHKISDQYGIMAAIIPGAHEEDNQPIRTGSAIPTTSDGDGIVLDSSRLVQSGGLDRYQGILGPDGGEALVLHND